MSEPQPVICQLYMTEADDPEMDICKGCEGESLQVHGSGPAEVITSWLADGAGELGTADPADTFRFEGDGAGNLRIAAELGAVPCDGVGGDDKGVVLLIPGIKARCAPRPLFADRGDAQQVMPAEKRPYSFMKFHSFQGGGFFVSGINILLLVPPVSINIEASQGKYPVDHCHHQVINRLRPAVE